MRIAVAGEEGEGKTLSMTVFGIMASNLFDVPLAGNYKVNWQKYEEIRTYEQLVKYQNGVLLFDEMWLSVDSREAQKNVPFTRWVKQTRKKHLLMFYTVQSLDQIDKRVKESTKLLMWCERRGERIEVSFLRFRTMRFLRKFVIPVAPDFYDLYDTDDLVDVFADVVS